MTSDISSIRDITIEKVKATCVEEISELFGVWEETGYKNEALNTYADQVQNHVEVLLKEMVAESNQKKKDLAKNIKNLINAAIKISKELGTNFITNEYDDLALIELEDKLKIRVEELNNLKNLRLKCIEELLTKEAEICKLTDATTIGFKNSLPNGDEVLEFEKYLKKIELEKEELSEVFMDSREAIIKMMEELQIRPALNFERIIYHEPNKFILSPSNMSQLKDLNERLKNQIVQAKILVQEKKETLDSLWDYLDEPAENRETFLKTHVGFGSVTLNALNAEIKRCKKKRSENVSKYVKKVRNEIENYWELCKYSELQKKAFTVMKCQTYTEDLLTLHEMEAENLRKFYNNNKKVFELIDEWEVLFEKYKELDQRANDPDRYHNRGGQLLVEEKERKIVEKELPKIVKKLFSHVDDYEKTSKNNFTVYGLSLEEFMNKAHDNYEMEKENLKQARKQAKDKSAKKTPLSISKRTPCMLRVTLARSRTPGTNISCFTPASSNRLRTPGTNISRFPLSVKRKLLHDDSPNNSTKKLRSTEKPREAVVYNNIKKSLKIKQNNNVKALDANCSIINVNTNKNEQRLQNESTLSISSYGNSQEHIDDCCKRNDRRAKNRINTTSTKIHIKPETRKGASRAPANLIRTRSIAQRLRSFDNHL